MMLYFECMTLMCEKHNIQFGTQDLYICTHFICSIPCILLHPKYKINFTFILFQIKWENQNMAIKQIMSALLAKTISIQALSTGGEHLICTHVNGKVFLFLEFHKIDSYTYHVLQTGIIWDRVLKREGIYYFILDLDIGNGTPDLTNHIAPIIIILVEVDFVRMTNGQLHKHLTEYIYNFLNYSKIWWKLM